MSSNKILSNRAITLNQHTSAGATAEDVAYVSAKNLEHFAIGYVRTALTGVLSALSIIVSDDASGTTTGIVLSHALGTAVDAVGDQVYLEVNAADIKAAAIAAGISDTDLYVAARVTEAAISTKSVLLYTNIVNHAEDGLTADVIT